MSKDVFKPRGKLKKNLPGAGVTSVIEVPVIATVMSTVDPTHQGRIAVYLSENLDKNAYNQDNWVYVSRLATFFGNTEAIGGPDDFGEYTANPSSYGQWNAPPDKLTQVICIFVNGDPNYGFYIGSAPKAETLSMIPAVGSSDNVTLNEGEASSYAGAPRLPTTNINVNNPDIADSTSYLTDAKPVHSYTASIMQQQGILRDKYRGPISTSATREASSRVGWGVSTPGRPVYQGGLTDEDIASKLDLAPENYRVVTRRGGHSLVMDDGDIIGRDQLIRLRTALGHQILMSDDGQMLSILHSNGQTYIELGKEGTVDIFATNSVNVRTQGDLNLHADETLNLSGKNVNINSSENTTLNADKAFSQRVGEDYSLYTLQNLKIKADAALALEATGQVGIKSAAEIFNEGSKIHLNDGAASLTPEVVEPIDIIMHPDTLFDETVGWAAALAKIPSITSRAPAHMPWMNANQGADVQVDPSAEGSLPEAPSGSLTNLNSNIGDLGVAGPPVSPTAASSISEVGAISSALDKNATTTLLAGVASKAIGDSVGGAVAGLTNSVSGVASSASSLTLGKFGQTPSQMSAGGILKPGADTLVNTLVSANVGGSAVNAIKGAVPSNVLPNSAFTGKGGVSSVEQYVGSTSSQAKGVVQTLQKGQKALQTVGAITGKEASGGLGSVVSGVLTSKSAGGNLGDNVKTVSGIINKSTSGGIAGAITGGGQDVLNSMKSGAQAVVTSQLSGAVGGVTKALNTLGGAFPGTGIGLDLNIGAAASSFKSITASFGKLKAGVPQDLTAIAGEAAAKVSGASSGMSALDLADPSSITGDLAASVGAGALGGVASQLTTASGAVNSATSIASGAVSSVTGAVAGIANKAPSGALGAINNAVSDVRSVSSSVTSLTQTNTLQNAATKVQRGATATISSTIASGVSNLPGGQKLGSSVINNAKGSVNAIADGIGGVTSSLSNVASKAFSGTDVGGAIKAGKSALGAIDKLGSVTGGLSSSLSPGAAAALESALSSLTAGGGSTIKLPTVAINTYDRTSLTSLIDNVLGNPIIPRPNLLGEISAGAVSSVMALQQLRKDLSGDIKKLNAMQKDVAEKQRAVFAAQSNFPAGSAEIAAAEAMYQSAATSPALLSLINKVESAKENIAGSIVTPPQPSPATDPFSDIEKVLQSASDSTKNQAINSESNDVAPTGDDFRLDPYNQNDFTGQYTSDTYSDIIATTTKTFIEPIYEIVDEGANVPENTVEAITGGITDGMVGGAAQSGEFYGDVNPGNEMGQGGYGGGGGYWYWDQVGTWKLK